MRKIAASVYRAFTVSPQTRGAIEQMSARSSTHYAIEALADQLSAGGRVTQRGQRRHQRAQGL
jgi:hypothetical protein